MPNPQDPDAGNKPRSRPATISDKIVHQQKPPADINSKIEGTQEQNTGMDIHNDEPGDNE